jgi:hypothetical protein
MSHGFGVESLGGESHAITIAAVIQIAIRPIIKCLTIYTIKNTG